MRLFTTQLLIRCLNFITNIHNDFNFGRKLAFLVVLGVFWCWILRKIEVEFMVKMLVRSSGAYHMAAIHVMDPFSRFFGEFPCGDRI
jgi:hypothetical protein